MMIKLPVTVEGDAFFYDADDKIVSAHDLAAALNAAPTRAFDGLTAKALETIFDEADEDVKRRLDKSSGAREWHDAIYDAILSRLQAFAAPQAPQWQPIETAPRDGTIILLYSREAEVCFGRWHKNPAIEWLASSNGFDSVAFPKDAFTHWMPLPAAPEAQGGE